VDKQGLDGSTVFRIELGADILTITYRTATGVSTLSVTDNYIPSNTWSHVAIQVSQLLDEPHHDPVEMVLLQSNVKRFMVNLRIMNLYCGVCTDRGWVLNSRIFESKHATYGISE